MDRTVYIGVDPAGTRLHAVVIRGDGFSLATRQLPSEAVVRVVAADRWIYSLVKQYRRDGASVVVAVEEPVLGLRGRAGANATLPNAKVHGALLASAMRAKAVVIPVNNMRWKKVVVGKGNAGKPQIAAFVKRTWPKLYIEAKGVQDFMDASCIARYAQYVVKARARMDATRSRNGCD